MPKLNLRETVARIDFLGLITGTAAVILLLIPTSEGGHAGTPWSSPLVIAMFTIGGICFIVFLLIEWKWAELPMMPLSMFRKASVSAMMVQSFLVGTVYYTYIYFLPLYFQNVRGMTPLMSAVMQLPLVVIQSIVSTSAGYYISRRNRYIEVIWFGFGIWTLGAGLLILANDTIHLGLVALFLMIVGCGTGCTFQPTLVALQAHCPKAQRAVVTSNRNFLRQGGAAVGLAVSSAIMANVLKASFPKRLEALAENSFAAPNLANFSLQDQAAIKGAYSAASRAVFIFCTPLVGICFVLSVFIKDHGLIRKEERDLPDTSLPPETERSPQVRSFEDCEEGGTGSLDMEKDVASDSKSVEVASQTGNIEGSGAPSLSSEKSSNSRIP